MKSKKYLCLLALSVLTLTGCGEAKVSAIEKSDAISKLNTASENTENWKGFTIKETAKISVSGDFSSEVNNLVTSSLKLDVNSSLKGSAELNADEMAKIKSGDVENVDYANLVTASLTTSNSVKYDLKTTINSNESYVTTDVNIGGSLKYGKTTYNNITSDFLVGNINTKTKVKSNMQGTNNGTTEKSDFYGVYNIASSVKNIVGNIDTSDTPSTDVTIDSSLLEKLVAKLDSYISFGANDNMIQVKIDVNDQLLADIMANGNIKLPSEIGDITLPKVIAESAIYINAYLDKNGGFSKFSIDVSKLSLSFNYNLSGLNMACQADVNYSLIINNSSKEVDSITASDFSKEVQLIDLSTLLK